MRRWSRPGSDRALAEQAQAERAQVLEQWDGLKLELAGALEQRDGLADETAALGANLAERDRQLAAANSTIESMGEENRSLLTFVNALEGDLNAREAALRDSESKLEEGQAAFLRLTSEAEANQAFFDLVVGQCTALMGWEGGEEADIDRQALAYECAAAFESARRWRADLTEMVDLRDRSLQACEARQAALEAQSCPQPLDD